MASLARHLAGGQGQGPRPDPRLGKVIEYLVKKGYHQTERMLRHESSHTDASGKPIVDRAEDSGPTKYAIALRMLIDWVDGNLDIYKSELKRLLWPVFVYSFLQLVADDESTEAHAFRREFGPAFERTHSDELRVFQYITLIPHVFENETAKTYRNNKYRLLLNSDVYHNLITFLETKSKSGGSVVILLLSTYFDVRKTDRGPIDRLTFDNITNRNSPHDFDETTAQEGLPATAKGLSSKNVMDNSPALKLGMMPMETELYEEVHDDLAEEDSKRPPKAGQLSLVEEFEGIVKREDSIDAPARNDYPQEPSRARDVVMEIQKVKEYRDRFRIETRTGGVGAGACICMYTMHNTMLSVNCIEFSDDLHMLAVGTSDSYIRVWDLTGEGLESMIPSDRAKPHSRMLIGHSGPVYGLSFNKCIEGPARSSNKEVDDDVPETTPQLLLSCSGDGAIRLWSLETWTCLVVYKGHDGAVWDVRYGPFSHYFLTCGRDRTVRLWVQDRIVWQRCMIGHDTSVQHIAWHPNAVYIFSASDGDDKSIRMWSVPTGDPVRIFNGHVDNISALECAPNGKIIASADTGGSIMLWDIQKGALIKRCRGHGRGGIWSLSWSVESTIFSSGGADGTVRIWDVEVPTDASKTNDGEVVAVGGQADATRINAHPTVTQAAAGPSGLGGSGGSKKKGKETMITPDQIGAYPTKQSPITKVKFTRMNLLVAAGCFQG